MTTSQLDYLAKYVRASKNLTCRRERLRAVVAVLRSEGWSEAQIREWKTKI